MPIPKLNRHPTGAPPVPVLGVFLGVFSAPVKTDGILDDMRDQCDRTPVLISFKMAPVNE